MRSLIKLLVLALALTTVGAPAAPRPDTPLVSGNVTLLGNIPEAGAVGGQVRTVNTLTGPKTYFVMTSARGVSAYDITIPEAPVLAGHLPLPHWENEDVTFSEDLLIVSQDPQWFFVPPPEMLGGLYLIDISQLPLMTFAYTNPATGNRWTEPVQNWAGHTTSCLDDACDYAVVNGENEVPVIDLRDPANPKVVNTINSGLGYTHDVQLDETGLAWMVGNGGTKAFDVSDPVNPRAVTPSIRGALTGLHHNSFRPDAASWQPRSLVEFTAPEVRPGEAIFITEEEIYGQVACDGQGRFGAARVRDTDALTSGAEPVLDMVDTWQTEVTALGINASGVCSAHYFDERDGIVAISWYEEGLRFLDVSNPRDIRQVGYYINKSGVAVNVKWIGPGAGGGEILYVMDESRGLDIVRFDRAPDAPTVRAPILPEWLEQGAPATSLPHPRFGYACRLAA